MLTIIILGFPVIIWEPEQMFTLLGFSWFYDELIWRHKA